MIRVITWQKILIIFMILRIQLCRARKAWYKLFFNFFTIFIFSKALYSYTMNIADLHFKQTCWVNNSFNNTLRK